MVQLYQYHWYFLDNNIILFIINRIQTQENVENVFLINNYFIILFQISFC
jgi:hypothetical protein